MTIGNAELPRKRPREYCFPVQLEDDREFGVRARLFKHSLCRKKLFCEYPRFLSYSGMSWSVKNPTGDITVLSQVTSWYGWDNKKASIHFNSLGLVYVCLQRLRPIKKSLLRHQLLRRQLQLPNKTKHDSFWEHKETWVSMIWAPSGRVSSYYNQH